MVRIRMRTRSLVPPDVRSLVPDPTPPFSLIPRPHTSVNGVLYLESIPIISCDSAVQAMPWMWKTIHQVCCLIQY